MVSFFLLTHYLNAQVSSNMSLLANWNGNTTSHSGILYNDCWGYVDGKGNEYAIIGSPEKIHFIDITDPFIPVLKNEFVGGSMSTWRDMKTYDCYTYAVSDPIVGQEGLLIFDMSALPEGPITKVLQDNSTFKKAHNIYVDVPNARLYIIGSDTRNNGLIVYDLSKDPANPVLLASVSLPGGYIHDLIVKDHIAYCSSGFEGLYIYDFEDPADPIYKASISSNGYNHSCWLTEDGTKLIYAEEIPIGLPMRMIDLAGIEEDDLEEISSFQDPLITTNSKVTYHNPYIIDQYAIVSSYEDGVVIFDLSNPEAPTRVAYYDTFDNTTYTGYNGCWGVYPYFPSGNIIASDVISGLFILSTSLTLTSDCNNGQLDAFEQTTDRGGFCRSNCANSGNKCTDFDKDGFSAELDCDDYNPLIPAAIGSLCNDGNSATTNDKIQADGCTCKGE